MSNLLGGGALKPGIEFGLKFDCRGKSDFGGGFEIATTICN